MNGMEGILDSGLTTPIDRMNRILDLAKGVDSRLRRNDDGRLATMP